MNPKYFTTALSVLIFTICSVPMIKSQCLSDDDTVKSLNNNLYAGQQNFTLALLDSLHKATPHESIFFSPYSTYHALLLAYFGARHATEDSLKDALRLNWAKSKAEVREAYNLDKQATFDRSRNQSVEFSSVDKIFVSKEAQLRDCVQNLFTENLETLDFAQDPEQCRRKINGFVENVTKGNIKDLLIPGTVTESTNLVLANAAFFKGQWASKFNPDNTGPEIFYDFVNNHQTFVDMMQKRGYYNYAANEKLDCVILEMPYLGEENGISMYIFLPKFQPNAIDELLGKLTVDSLKEALEDGIMREVDIKLPKVSFEKTYQLVPVLRRMGIGNLFESNADLSSFSDKTHLTLDDAVHKARIEINEEGSTAAAATALFSFRSSRPLEPAQFYCNHPFMFLIYDHKTQGILFTGIYKGPSK